MEKVKLICPNIILNYSMYSFEIPPQALFTLMSLGQLRSLSLQSNEFQITLIYISIRSHFNRTFVYSENSHTCFERENMLFDSFLYAHDPPPVFCEVGPGFLNAFILYFVSHVLRPGQYASSYTLEVALTHARKAYQTESKAKRGGSIYT